MRKLEFLYLAWRSGVPVPGPTHYGADIGGYSTMTLLLAENCPPAYGGCVCACHRTPGMVHTAACCGPGREQLLASCESRTELPMLNVCLHCGFAFGRHDIECPYFYKP
jgi:hypothetical protein